jgi:hypothetical protein
MVDDALMTMDDTPAAADPAVAGGPNRRLVLLVAIAFAAIVALGLALERAYSDGGASEGAAGGDVTDGFDRSDEGAALGVAPTGQEWEVVSGAVELEAGVASVVAGDDDDPRTLAVIPMGGTDGTVDATVASMASGWGLVFRYANPFDYWYVSAVPAFATYNIVRVADGRDEVVGRTGLAEVAPGTKVEVALDGPVIEVSVDGALVYTTADDHAFGATRAGLISLVADSRVAWDEFRARPDRTGATPAAPILRDPIGSAGDEGDEEVDDGGSEDDGGAADRPGTGEGAPPATDEGDG